MPLSLSLNRDDGDGDEKNDEKSGGNNDGDFAMRLDDDDRKIFLFVCFWSISGVHKFPNLRIWCLFLLQQEFVVNFGRENVVGLCWNDVTNVNLLKSITSTTTIP